MGTIRLVLAHSKLISFWYLARVCYLRKAAADEWIKVCGCWNGKCVRFSRLTLTSIWIMRARPKRKCKNPEQIIANGSTGQLFANWKWSPVGGCSSYAVGSIFGYGGARADQLLLVPAPGRIYQCDWVESGHFLSLFPYWGRAGAALWTGQLPFDPRDDEPI